MYYQILYGRQNAQHQIIDCDNDEDAQHVAYSIYRGWASNQSIPGFCIIKRGYGYDISNSNFDILVTDCM